MCGLVGFYDKRGQLSSSQQNLVIGKMVKEIRHRGRDGEGFFIDQKNHFALGHARLSILDLSSAAAQPLKKGKEPSVLAYNGEIYNFKKLKEELSDSFSFTSTGDTEVLLRGWQKWGKEILNRVKGMFSLAIYEPKAKTLFLAVDRFGIKPLYVYEDENWFAFASEIKAFWSIPGVRPQLAKKNLPEFFSYRWIAGKHTLFNNVQRLEPGKYLSFNISDSSKVYKQYYTVKKRSIPSDPKKRLQTLKNLLVQSVTEHLESDVPIGVQLSGGIDSSLLTNLVSERKKNLHSFSIGLQKKGWNEFKYSRLVAKKTKTIHHEFSFDEKDFCQALPKMTFHMDEPINHPHSIPMYLLSEKARKYVKVLLSGEGADEIFFGYTRYKKLRTMNKISDSALLNSCRFVDNETLKKVLLLPLSDAKKTRSSIIDKHKSSFDKLFHLEMVTYLVPLLIRQDKMGMAANIENRVPFLDHELVEFAYSLPLASKISSEESKILLKKIAEQYLPKSLIYRPKVGFGLPQSEWLRNPKGLGKYLRFFTDHIVTKRAYLNYSALQIMIEDHQSKKQDYGQLLWIMVAYEVWAQIFLDGISPEAIIESLN